MNTRLRLLIFVLAVPLLAALSSSAARDRWDERWRAGLGREFRANRPDRIERAVHFDRSQGDRNR